MTDLILLIPLRELGVYTKNTIPSIVTDDKRDSTCSKYLRSFPTLLNFEERPDVKSAYVRQRVTVGKTSTIHFLQSYGRSATLSA